MPKRILGIVKEEVKGSTPSVKKILTTHDLPKLTPKSFPLPGKIITTKDVRKK